MARVSRIEIEESGYRFRFVPEQRPTGSIKPQLAATEDLKSNIEDPGKDTPKHIKRKAYALAAVVFNKFKN